MGVILVSSQFSFGEGKRECRMVDTSDPSLRYHCTFYCVVRVLSIYEFDSFVFYFIFAFVCLLRLHNLMLDVLHESIYKSQLLTEVET